MTSFRTARAGRGLLIDYGNGAPVFPHGAREGALLLPAHVLAAGKRGGSPRGAPGRDANDAPILRTIAGDRGDVNG